MEVRPNKALTIAMLFSASALAGVLAIFHYGERSEMGTYDKALKFKKETSRSISSAIVFREEKGPEQAQKAQSKGPSEKKEFYSHEEYDHRLDAPGLKSAVELEELEKSRQELVSGLMKRSESVPFYLEFSPELNIALSILTEVEPSGLNRQDVDRLNFESEQWYFVKAFAASEDFKILLSQGRLTRESMAPAKLKRLYGSAHHFAARP